MRLSPVPPPIAVPQRFPPLAWRKPAWAWAPIGVVLGLGWPALALRQESGLAPMVLIGGALAFALAAISLGAAWAMRRPPRTYKTVLAHVLAAGLIVALAAPFAFTHLLEWIARSEGGEGGLGLPSRLNVLLWPLALLIGLPTLCFAGLAFALCAFVKPPPRPLEAWTDDEAEPHLMLTETVRDVERLA